MSTSDDSSIADARTLKLAKRKRASKRAMCEELVNELEKGLSLFEDSEEDDKAKMLAGLLGGKSSLLDLKKELVSLDLMMTTSHWSVMMMMRRIFCQESHSCIVEYNKL